MGGSRSAEQAEKEIKTGADLGMFRAIVHALCSKRIDFYPRVVRESAATSLETDQVLKETAEASASWRSIANYSDVDSAIELARQSLTEVSHQTEYQDQKATRLLTVTTFLTALAGLLFTRFQDSYPLGASDDWQALFLVGVTYLLFIAFVLTALLGAIVVFHATRTRFKYPETGKIGAAEAPPKSLLFYTGIVRAQPGAWMRAWVDQNGPGRPTISAHLKHAYLQNLVSETYLVAAKTADKLRYLQPAQELLANSLRCLLVWIVFLILTSSCVQPAKPDQDPVIVRVLEKDAGLSASDPRQLPKGEKTEPHADQAYDNSAPLSAVPQVSSDPALAPNAEDTESVPQTGATQRDLEVE